MEKQSQSTPLPILVVAAFLMLLLAPGSAEACCTNTLCDYCISSSSDCTNSRCLESRACVVTWVPTCNTFGCNCNNTGPTCQCGSPTGGGSACIPIDCCGPGGDPAVAQTRFKEVDANGDGSISVVETEQWLTKTFGTDWTNHVDREDVATAGSPAKTLQLIFDRVDTDRSKSISPAEFDNTLGYAKE